MEIPFSTQYNWQIKWNRISSSSKVDVLQCDSPKEEKALQALADMDVISGQGLLKLFSLPRKQLKKMGKERKLLRHELIRQKDGRDHIIPIYTLGPSGAVVAGLTNYKINYWMDYQMEEILQRLVAAELLPFFDQISIIPAPAPFVAGFQYAGSDHSFYIYVYRGQTDDFLRYLKWETDKERRLLIIVEELEHIHPLIPFLQEFKVRITTDKNITEKQFGDDDFFYRIKEGTLISETGKKVI